MSKKTEFDLLNKNIEPSEYNLDFIKNNRLIFWDTETTGLHAEEGDRIIQFAGVEVINGKITRKVEFLINPEGKSVGESYEVHKISDETLADQPLFVEKMPEIIEFMKGAFILAHNQAFDKKFLNKEIEIACEKLGQENFKIEDLITGELDTYFFSRSFYASSPSHTLDALAEKAKVDLTIRKDRHDALIDTEILCQAFLEHILNKGFDLSLLKNFDQLSKGKGFKPLNIDKQIDPIFVNVSEEDLLLDKEYLNEINPKSKEENKTKLKI